MSVSKQTESYQALSNPRNAGATRGAYLVVALSGNRPSEIPLRVSIAKAERVELRRAERRLVHRNLIDGKRVCQVGLVDKTMSSLHAFVVQDGSGTFRLWDCGSKNGTTLNGTRIEGSVELGDGDLISVGSTHLFFRSAPDCYLHKPFDAEALDAPMATANPAFARAVAKTREIAKTDLSVLITGPSGSDRETAARWIHDVSVRAGPFVRLSCGELVKQIASVRRAKGGTLFVANLEDLSNQAASVLASVLDPSEWANASASGDDLSVRVVASGLPDAKSTLSPRTASRVAALVLEMPSLAERSEDIGLFISRALRDLGAPESTTLEPSAARALLGHTWPGNLHELRAVIRRALALAGLASIARYHLPEAITANEVQAVERRQLITLLRKHLGNVSAVAREMKISRFQVRRLADDFGIRVDTYRNR